MPKNIYDNRGNKIGEVRDAGEEAAGVVLLLYLIWKALPLLLVLGGICLLIEGGRWVWTAGANLVRYGTVSEQEAQVRASATQIAEGNIWLLAEADRAIADEDYYIAAAILRGIVSRQPDNEQARVRLAQIARQVPGGLVIGGNSGVYLPFSDAEPYTFLDSTRGAELLAVSLDGHLAFMKTNYTTFVIDFTNGSYTLLDGVVSPDFTKVVKITGDGITKGELGGVYDRTTGDELFEITCAAWNSTIQWMSDSRFIITVNGNSNSVAMIDSDDGNCETVSIPGLGWGSIAAIAPDSEHLLIITPGDSISMDHAKVFVANLDGRGIRQITKLPIFGLEDSYILMAPDRSTVYLPEEGILISTRTGRWNGTIAGAIAWIYGPPPQAVLPQATITVSPSQGPRGTRFIFNLSGGLPKQEVVWSVVGTEHSGWVAFTDENGNLVDDWFSWQTDINTPVGSYTVKVVDERDRSPIAVASFSVTEP